MLLNGARIPRSVVARGVEQAPKAAAHGHAGFGQPGRDVHDILRPAQYIKLAIDVAFGQIVQAGGQKMPQGARPRQLHRHQRISPQIMLRAVPQNQPQGNVKVRLQARQKAGEQVKLRFHRNSHLVHHPNSICKKRRLLWRTVNRPPGACARASVRLCESCAMSDPSSRVSATAEPQA